MFIKAGLWGCIADEQAWRRRQEGKVRYLIEGGLTIVAIKKIKAGEMQGGLDMTALREVKFLQELRHPNIIAVSFSEYLT
jgi:hypothetical protein